MATHHGHGHQDHSAAFDFAEAAPRFKERAEAEAGKYLRLAAQLSTPDDKVAADIGCGAASMAFALAATLPEARVVAVDAEPAMLDLVRERAAENGVAVEAAPASVDDADALAAAVGEPADLLWAGHVIHHATDPQAALNNLAGLLAPGGRLAIGEGGTAPQYLPWHVGVGNPGLELRLIEAGSRRLEGETHAHGSKPLTYGWNLALERAGLTGVREVNELDAIPAPLEGAALRHALASLQTRSEWFEHYLSDEDKAAWARLLDEDGPDWLGRRRDLHHLSIDTYFIAVKP